MTPHEYQLETRRTRPAGEPRERALAHYALGLCEEAGELAGIIKKHVFYGQPIDRDALIKEAGDVLWYMTSLLDTVDVELSGTLNSAVELAKEDEAPPDESENATEADDGSEPDRFFGAATDRESWILYNVYGLLDECNAPVSYAFECNRVGSRDARHHSKFALYHLYHLLSLFDITLHEVMAANVAKLRARYPQGWTAADAAERKDDGMTARAQRSAELDRERVKAYCAGLLDAAAHCDDYAAVVADDPDDLDAEGPHETHVSVARHLARELRTIADRCVRGVRLP